MSVNGLDVDSQEETFELLKAVRAEAVRLLRENQALKAENAKLKQELTDGHKMLSQVVESLCPK